MLTTIGSFTSLAGVMLYEKFFKKSEVRSVIRLSILVSILGLFF